MTEIAGPTEPLDEVDEHRMPLMEHLRELRTRVMWSAAGLGLGMLASLGMVEQIYGWLTYPFELAIERAGVDGGLSIVHSPFEGIYTYLRVAFAGAVVLASPLLALEAWLFIAPGLYKTEQKVVVPLAMSSTVLFLLGATFAYYVIFPVAFPFFLQIIEVEASLSIGGYLTAVVRMMLAFGVCFQLPVATWFLARMGLIDHMDMIKGFRYAIVVIFGVAALITPPEVLTQVLLALPLSVLYAIGIGVAWFSTTKVRDDA